MEGALPALKSLQGNYGLSPAGLIALSRALHDCVGTSDRCPGATYARSNHNGRSKRDNHRRWGHYGRANQTVPATRKDCMGPTEEDLVKNKLQEAGRRNVKVIDMDRYLGFFPEDIAES